jgi:hypothetical protein
MPARPVISSHPQAEWVNGAEACRILSCAPSTLQRASMIGLIRVQLEPGVSPRYSRVDCESHRGAGGTKARQKKGRGDTAHEKDRMTEGKLAGKPRSAAPANGKENP